MSITKKTKNPRKEADIFAEIQTLCIQPGFVHAIAYFCFRDNTVMYKNEITGDDLSKMRSNDRLIQTEISTLIGCMCKTSLQFELPKPDEMQRYISDAETLLKEMHDRLTDDAYGNLNFKEIQAGKSPMESGEAVREAVFYASQSAYPFQYREMASERYAKDADWILENKGFGIDKIELISKAISDHQNNRMAENRDEMRASRPENWTFLPAYILSPSKISEMSGVPRNHVDAFLEAFSTDDNHINETFTSLDAFNVVTAQPILKTDSGDYILFQYYNLVEAMYDSPFYWFCGDTEYFPTATKNRGEFTEDFLNRKLEQVFGPDNVFRNIDIYKGKDRYCEIDNMVIFGEFAIIFQAKSQRLTIPARRGNNRQIQADFKRGVQNAYNQAAKCEMALNNDDFRLVDSFGKVIEVREIETVYPVCVLSDHFPALSMQVREFLKDSTNSRLKGALATDLFVIDVMAEMLPSPLRFLSYIALREQFQDQILVTNE